MELSLGSVECPLFLKYKGINSDLRKGQVRLKIGANFAVRIKNSGERERERALLLTVSNSLSFFEDGAQNPQRNFIFQHSVKTP